MFTTQHDRPFRLILSWNQSLPSGSSCVGREFLCSWAPVSRYNHGVEITYDPRKSERNLRERGIGFEIVKEFDFASAVYAIDTRKDYGEVRTRALGSIGEVLYALVFTMRGGALRVISLRKANRKERGRYGKAKS